MEPVIEDSTVPSTEEAPVEAAASPTEAAEPPPSAQQNTEGDSAAVPPGNEAGADADAAREAEPPTSSSPPPSSPPPPPTATVAVEEHAEAAAPSPAPVSSSASTPPLPPVNQPQQPLPAPSTHQRKASGSGTAVPAASTKSRRAAAGPSGTTTTAPRSTSQKAKAAAVASASSSRPSGREVILHASQLGSELMTTGPHLNAHHLTPGEEYAIFRHKNRVAETFKGPVYVAEDVQVACQACGGPLDPITRVPVGKLFFHLHCLKCALCGKDGITEAFQQVGEHAICMACAAKGYSRCVRKEMAAASVPANRATSAARRSARAELQPFGEPCTINRPTLPGAMAPSLSISPVHNERNTGLRSFALMQRQQYYTQNDCNLLQSRPRVMVEATEDDDAAYAERRAPLPSAAVEDGDERAGPAGDTAVALPQLT